MVWTPIITAAAESISSIADKFFVDKTQKAEFERDVKVALEETNQALIALRRDNIHLEAAKVQGRAAIIAGEVASTSWLARSWRPITMLNFLVLLNLFYFGYLPPNLSPEMAAELVEIIKFGLGGFLGLRTAEKTAPVLAKAIAAIGKDKLSEVEEVPLPTVDTDDEEDIAQSVTPAAIKKIANRRPTFYRPGRK